MVRKNRKASTQGWLKSFETVARIAHLFRRVPQIFSLQFLGKGVQYLAAKGVPIGVEMRTILAAPSLLRKHYAAHDSSVAAALLVFATYSSSALSVTVDNRPAPIPYVKPGAQGDGAVRWKAVAGRKGSKFGDAFGMTSSIILKPIAKVESRCRNCLQALTASTHQPTQMQLRVHSLKSA